MAGYRLARSSFRFCLFLFSMAVLSWSGLYPLYFCKKSRDVSGAEGRGRSHRNYFKMTTKTPMPCITYSWRWLPSMCPLLPKTDWAPVAPLYRCQLAPRLSLLELGAPRPSEDGAASLPRQNRGRRNWEWSLSLALAASSFNNLHISTLTNTHQHPTYSTRPAPTLSDNEASATLRTSSPTLPSPAPHRPKSLHTTTPCLEPLVSPNMLLRLRGPDGMLRLEVDKKDNFSKLGEQVRKSRVRPCSRLAC